MKSTCFRCQNPINPGQSIVHRSYGDYHEGCYREICTKGPSIPGIGATALLLFLLVLPAFARPNPQMSYKGQGNAVRCEAKYVYPVIPLWSAGETDYGKGYGEGFGMTMRVGEDWTRVEMTVAEQMLQVEARVVNGKAQFRPVRDQVASKPP